MEGNAGDSIQTDGMMELEQQAGIHSAKATSASINRNASKEYFPWTLNYSHSLFPARSRNMLLAG